MADRYDIAREDVWRAVALGAWLAGCDWLLKGFGRLAACDPAGDLWLALLSAWESPPDCSAGTSGQSWLRPALRTTGPFGLGDSLDGVMGTVYALSLTAFAAIVTVLVVRWRWRTGGDALALAALWTGALLEGATRMVLDGSGRSELVLGGIPLSISDLALTWGLVWLALRAVGELRA